MKTRRDYSHLPVIEQIKKLNFKIKFLFIFSFVWSAFLITASILLWILLSEWELAIGFLITLPLSLFLGGYLQIKEYKKAISKLEEENSL